MFQLIPYLRAISLCVSVVERDIHWLAAWFEGNIQYHCCKKEQSGNETVVQCDLPVQYSRWFMVFYHVLTLGIIVLFFFWPAVIPLLQKQSDDAEINNHEIPVQDLSPISCRTLWHRHWSRFRTSGDSRSLGTVEIMIMSYYFRVLFYAYIFLVLNYAFFLDYLTEADTKNAFPDNALFYYVFDIRSSKLYCLIPVIIFFIILPVNFFFLIAYASNKIDRDIYRKMIDNLHVLRARQLYLFFNSYVRKQKSRLNKSVDMMVRRSSIYVVEYLKNKSVRSSKMLFLILFSFLSTTFVIFRILLTVLALIFLVAQYFLMVLFFILSLAVDVIRFSPFTTFTKIIYKFIKENLTKTCLYFCMPVFLAWMIYFSLAVTVCCGFYIRMFGFVIVGLIVNAQKTIPYVTFIFVLISNISTCYNTFRKRFKEMKKIIFKYYKKRTVSLPNVEITRKTIPQKLFWDICKKVLPIEQELFAMLANMLIISSISLLALAIIVFFGGVLNSSTLVEAGAVLLSGKLTRTLFNGLIKSEKFTGWEKIEKSQKIKESVDTWINQPVNEEKTLANEGSVEESVDAWINQPVNEEEFLETEV